MVIDDEILDRLVPKHIPDVGSGSDMDNPDESRPQKRIRYWSEYVRNELRNQIAEKDTAFPQPGGLPLLQEEIDGCLFVGIGIFRSSENSIKEADGFPNVMGYQFGVMIFHTGETDSEDRLSTLPTLPLTDRAGSVPVMKQAASFNLNCLLDDASSAAMVDAGGIACLLTAGHAVASKRKGQTVKGSCRSVPFGCSFTVEKKMVGNIDAALVKCGCGYPCNWGSSKRTFESQHNATRTPVQGAHIKAHFGHSGNTKKSSIVMALYSPSQILTSAAAKNFLIMDSGIQGDSGSLIATDHTVGDSDLRLVGMYLGDCDAEEPDGTISTYGFGVEIEQAVSVLRGNITGGIFNV